MPLPYKTLPGDVDRAISDDHAMLERLLQHIGAARGDRRILVDQVVYQLSMHTAAEEQVVYPALAEGARNGSALARAGRHEHQRMKEAAAELDRSAPGVPEFEEALDRLIGEFRQHVPEEETELLPALRAAAGALKMAELGNQFTAAKRKAPTHPHPSTPGTPTANKILSAPATIIDKARDLTSGREARLATDASGLLDPQAVAVLNAYAALGPKPIETLEPDQARQQPTPTDAVMKVLWDEGRPTEPERVSGVEDSAIPGPAGDITVRIYGPADVPAPTGGLPVLVYVHGGGWVIGDLDVYDTSARALANRGRCVVVSVEYRHAPEHPFPAAHDDVLAATRWVQDRAGDFGGDPARVAIAGESAGGNMAAATCLQLRDAGEPLPVFQLLIYPLTTGANDSTSFADSADAKPLNRPMVSWFAKHAFPTPEAAMDTRFELLGIPVERLAGLPPALVMTAERDPLRSQGQAFAERLAAAGVPTTLRNYRRVPHEFFGWAALVDTAREAQDEAGKALVAAFGR